MMADGKYLEGLSWGEDAYLFGRKLKVTTRDNDWRLSPGGFRLNKKEVSHNYSWAVMATVCGNELPDTGSIQGDQRPM